MLGGGRLCPTCAESLDIHLFLPQKVTIATPNMHLKTFWAAFRIWHDIFYLILIDFFLET